MNINKFNYESYALDYLEGTLSPEMVEEMERFLKIHPAIEAELSGMMELLVLEPDTSIVYEEKESLLKEEQVVWLSRKWVRPLMAAASILLLLTTFFVGYRAGVNQGETVVAIEEGSSSSSSSEVVVKKEIELPKVEKIAPEKVEEVIVKAIEKREQLAPVVELPKPTYVKEEVNKVEMGEEVVQPLQLFDNELIAEKVAEQNAKVNIEKPIYNTSFLETKTVLVSINSTKSSSLENALQTSVLIDEKILANYQKRKRSFKDLLGRFPVNNLKEALIPSYYKDEMAGQ